VDIDAAASQRHSGFNAPFSNTRSVAELVIGEIVFLFRRIVARSNAAHQGAGEVRQRQPESAARRSHRRLRQYRLAAVYLAERWGCG